MNMFEEFKLQELKRTMVKLLVGDDLINPIVTYQSNTLTIANHSYHVHDYFDDAAYQTLVWIVQIENATMKTIPSIENNVAHNFVRHEYNWDVV